MMMFILDYHFSNEGRNYSTELFQRERNTSEDVNPFESFFPVFSLKIAKPKRGSLSLPAHQLDYTHSCPHRLLPLNKSKKFYFLFLKIVVSVDSGAAVLLWFTSVFTLILQCWCFYSVFAYFLNWSCRTHESLFFGFHVFQESQVTEPKRKPLDGFSCRTAEQMMSFGCLLGRQRVETWSARDN